MSEINDLTEVFSSFVTCKIENLVKLVFKEVYVKTEGHKDF